MIFVLAAIVILALIGIVLKPKVSPKSLSGTVGKGPAKVQDISKLPPPTEIFSIGGTVEKIEGKTLTIKSFSSGDLKIYTVTVDNATQIEKREMKNDLSKPEEGKLFNPYNVRDASFSDIHQNDNVAIEA